MHCRETWIVENREKIPCLGVSSRGNFGELCVCVCVGGTKVRNKDERDNFILQKVVFTARWIKYRRKNEFTKISHTFVDYFCDPSFSNCSSSLA